jgi:hypothetical protein
MAGRLPAVGTMPGVPAAPLRRLVAALVPVALVVAACADDDGGSVRDEPAGSDSGSGSGSGSGSTSE